MKRVVVLTSRERGAASICLPSILSQSNVEVVGLFCSRNEMTPRQRWRSLRKKLMKAIRIGPLGTFNGMRIRRWYGRNLDALLQLESVRHMCKRAGVPYTEVPGINCEETVAAIQALRPDIGLSLGNGYISPRVFSIPLHGMLNIHHEELPAFRGAQSVIWQIYHGSEHSGFTVHRIDERIDTGAIVYTERIPIDFRELLGETVTSTLAESMRRSAEAIGRIVGNLDQALADARVQSNGESYTTPTYRQYRRMVRMHRRMWSARQKAIVAP